MEERLQEAGEHLGEARERVDERAREAERRTRPLRRDLLRGLERARILASEGLARGAATLRGSSSGADTTASRLAETLDRSATYLRQTDLSGMQRDAVALVRQYPYHALGAAFVAGVLIGQRLRRD
jgi:ElaB/YqjD/DUF883 family membrane-anchored ribosome-binding protein